MTTVMCYVGKLKAQSYWPLHDELQVNGYSIPHYFQQASMLDSGTPAIDLMIDSSGPHNLSSQGGSGVNEGQLQEALKQLLQPASSFKGPVVGLILADSYLGFENYVYGFMFDLDGEGPQIGPRQGCAVFLDKIYAAIDADGTNDQGFRDLLAYAAIHELGHVFNLWHLEDSFMAPSPDTFLKVFEFEDIHKQYLRNAVDPMNACYVLPGGSNFNDRGTIGPRGDDELPYSSVAVEPLKLEIRLSHQEFWYFEPVELDVILSVPDPTLGTVTISDEIDPGYACFDIWITRPDGERFRFRSAKHFCGNSKQREISHKEPFIRDISIFRQSGGYTFSMAGKYEIQSVLRLSAGKSLASNTIECEVLRAEPDSKIYSSMYEAFMPAEAVNLLRYRSRMPSYADYLRLKQFADSFSSSASAAAVHYSLGRALIKSSDEANASRSGHLRKHGLLHLEDAIKQTQLSTHRRTITERLMSGSKG